MKNKVLFRYHCCTKFDQKQKCEVYRFYMGISFEIKIKKQN